MHGPQIRCRLFESLPNEVFGITRLDHAIREIDPESDPGIARLLARLRAVLVQRSQEANGDNAPSGHEQMDRWQRLRNGNGPH